MIADLKPYPSIKDSGVLNRSVPNHWLSGKPRRPQGGRAGTECDD